ncbi:hypothetical protein O181_091564, partial [Austropuccinia psidii MF-1]|nr:hypothetical protein [Austropuccinia psidii MF-1]
HHEPISSSEEVHGARKERGTSKGLDTHVFQRKSPTDKILVEKPEKVIRGLEEIGPGKAKQPSGRSPSLHKPNSASKNSKQAQSNPKEQPDGKVKDQVKQALPTELQYSQEREESHGQCVQYGKNSDGIQKQGRGKIEQIFSEEVDLVKQLKELRIQVQNLENSIAHNAALFQEQLEKSDKSRLELKEDIQSSNNNCHRSSYGSKSGLALRKQELTWRAPNE